MSWEAVNGAVSNRRTCAQVETQNTHVGGGQRCELKVKSCLEEEVLCRLPMDHLFSVVFLLGKMTPHISPLASVRCRGCRWSVLSP